MFRCDICPGNCLPRCCCGLVIQMLCDRFRIRALSIGCFRSCFVVCGCPVGHRLVSLHAVSCTVKAGRIMCNSVGHCSGLFCRVCDFAVRCRCRGSLSTPFTVCACLLHSVIVQRIVYRCSGLHSTCQIRTVQNDKPFPCGLKVIVYRCMTCSRLYGINECK